MNKFACSALALAAAGSVGFADPADDGEWLGLDQDIVDLHATSLQGGGGPEIGALIRSYWIDLDDDLNDLVDVVTDGDSDSDVGGWLFQDVDLWLEGEVGDFDWRVSLDYGDDDIAVLSFDSPPDSSSSDDSVLEDAYATWHIGDDLDVTWGQFKFGHTLSANVDPEDQVLIQRTRVGSLFDTWDHGVMVGGDFEDFSWRAAAQNGLDGVYDEYFLSGRAEYNLNGGSGGMKGMEGAVGGGDDIMATIGLFVADEGAVDDGTIYGGDFQATMDVFSLAGEIIGFDSDLFEDADETTPYSITASMVFGDDEFEAAVRYEDLDNDDDTTSFTGGVNWYLTGRNAYWSLNFTNLDSDSADDEGSILAFGLNVGSSRPN